jgi:hypothetical protein
LITSSTLVRGGELDALVPAANGRVLADHIPWAELMTVPLANRHFGTELQSSCSSYLDWLDFATAERRHRDHGGRRPAPSCFRFKAQHCRPLPCGQARRLGQHVPPCATVGR